MINFFRQFIDGVICCICLPRSLNAIHLFAATKAHNGIAEKVFLYNCSRMAHIEGDVVEIGSCYGSSGLLLAEGNRLRKSQEKVNLVDPEPQPSKSEFLKLFKSYSLEGQINFFHGASEDAGSKIEGQYRFIFIDGSHEYEYVKRDIEIWYPRLLKGGIIAFHDRTWPGVSRAIDEMRSSRKDICFSSTISGIFYAVKGEVIDLNLLALFERIESIRTKLISTFLRKR